jgi:serine/threonine-protein kinase HipA
VAIIMPDDTEELALTLAGKKRKLKREHFEEFAEGMGLTAKQLQAAFGRMAKNKPAAIDWIDRSFLSIEMKTAYKELLEAKYKQLELSV